MRPNPNNSFLYSVYNLYRVNQKGFWVNEWRKKDRNKIKVKLDRKFIRDHAHRVGLVLETQSDKIAVLPRDSIQCHKDGLKCSRERP